MRSLRRRRGRQKGRPLLVITIKSAFGVLAASFIITLVVFKGVIPVTGVLPLKGHVIYIDAGHGGIDPGACGSIYTEKEIVLKVALFLGVRLEQGGATIVYARTGDYDLESSSESDVEARIRLMKQSKATIVVSLHCNAFTDPYERGAQVFYNSSRHVDSKKLAESIQGELVRATDTEREISSKLDHFILNHADVPAVTVELGFLSNPSEEGLMGSSEYQQKLALCVHDGILDFLSRK